MNIQIGISIVADGTMSFSERENNQTVIRNRESFLSKHAINIHDSTRMLITYDTDDFCRYVEVSEDKKSHGMFDTNAPIADALVTRHPNHALFLPLADCVGAVIFDPIKQVLMLSHLGRHSLEQFGGRKSIEFLKHTYQSNPADLQVWLTPGPGQDNYPMFQFDNRSFKDVVFEQLQSAGILKDHIHDDPTDSTTDLNYFSHSEFLKGNRKTDGRYAIVAMMTHETNI